MRAKTEGARLKRIALCMILLAIGLLGSWQFGGVTGIKGMGLGLTGTSISILGLWMVVRLCGVAAPSGASARIGAAFSVLVFLVKLPIFIFCGLMAHRVGGNAYLAFLIGLGLVYLALVGWSLANR